MLQYSMVEIKIVMAYILSSQARLGGSNPQVYKIVDFKMLITLRFHEKTSRTINIVMTAEILGGSKEQS